MEFTDRAKKTYFHLCEVHLKLESELDFEPKIELYMWCTWDLSRDDTNVIPFVCSVLVDILLFFSNWSARSLEARTRVPCHIYALHIDWMDEWICSKWAHNVLFLRVSAFLFSTDVFKKTDRFLQHQENHKITLLLDHFKWLTLDCSFLFSRDTRENFSCFLLQNDIKIRENLVT